ncbi:MAG: HAMP domain-containing protein [Rhodospirillaceae bacterium]|nr:HAMP domain-containing protein [Rhodospirillaceae bacterium]
MPLRIQLIFAMVAALLISLVLVGTLAWWNAARSVNTEMHAAMDAAERVVRTTIAQLPATSDDPLYIERLIPAFDGNRHIKAVLVKSDGLAAATSAMASTGAPPSWFTRAVGVAPEIRDIPLPPEAAPYRAVTLQTDPRNEIGEVWARVRDDSLIMAVFCLATVLLGRWIVGHALSPLEKLSRGIAIIGTGNYAARVQSHGPPEISELADSFNTMAEHLGTLESKNHRLTGQLLTIQEEERTDLARDLHDEVGPFLFAVNVDAAAIARDAEAKGLSEIATQVRSIQESVTHMQRHVRAILRRLRPAGLQDVGLEQAVSNLAAFWQQRHAETAIRVHVAPGAADINEAHSAAIYRVIQESLSNAVRHGQSRGIDITVADIGDDIVVEVADDGVGLARPVTDAVSNTFGIVGMKERVAGLGGRLTVANRTDGCSGAIVTARLPRQTAEDISEPAAL